jgi:hypothetical protein
MSTLPRRQHPVNTAGVSAEARTPAGDAFSGLVARVFRLNGLLAAAGDALTSVVVDHSTVSPAGVVARWARMGTRYVHAPVFMAPQNARESTGIMMISGPRSIVEVAAAAGVPFFSLAVLGAGM